MTGPTTRTWWKCSSGDSRSTGGARPLARREGACRVSGRRWWRGSGPRSRRGHQLRHQLVFIAESPRDAAVDILQYGFGAIVLRGWFDDDIRDLLEPLEPLFFADDVLFSGYLASKGIQRICIGGMPLPRALEHRSTRALHGDGRATRNYQAAIPALAARLEHLGAGRAVRSAASRARRRSPSGGASVARSVSRHDPAAGHASDEVALT